MYVHYEKQIMICYTFPFTMRSLKVDVAHCIKTDNYLHRRRIWLEQIPSMAMSHLHWNEISLFWFEEKLKIKHQVELSQVLISFFL